MNVVNFREFVTRFRDKVPPGGFYMMWWWEEDEGCDTTACIGGWACHLFDLKGAGLAEWQAADFLGLSLDEAQRLFYEPGWAEDGLESRDYDKALDYLERCAEAGEILKR